MTACTYDSRLDHKLPFKRCWIVESANSGGQKGQKHAPLIKSPDPLQPENTQDTQDHQFSTLSEDEEWKDLIQVC